MVTVGAWERSTARNRNGAPFPHFRDLSVNVSPGSRPVVRHSRCGLDYGAKTSPTETRR